MSNQNVGHGHVFPRPDGVKARCGGPAICHVCAIEHARKSIAERVAAQPAADTIAKPQASLSSNLVNLTDDILEELIRKIGGTDVVAAAEVPAVLFALRELKEFRFFNNIPKATPEQIAEARRQRKLPPAVETGAPPFPIRPRQAMQSDESYVLSNLHTAAFLLDRHSAIETTGEVARLHETFQEVMALLADMLDADNFNNIEARVLEAGVPYPPVKVDPAPSVSSADHYQKSGSPACWCGHRKASHDEAGCCGICSCVGFSEKSSTERAG